MPLLGQAAIVIWSEMADPAGHDHWHSHEHLPERIGIPGFLRARRMVALDGSTPRYFVLYEVRDAGVTVSPQYLERLNHPTPWSQRTMADNRGLSRTLCVKAASTGRGVAACLLAMAIERPPVDVQADWAAEWFPRLVERPGLTGAHLLLRDAATEPPGTEEERLRGRRDARIDALLLFEGYDADALSSLGAALPSQGVSGTPHLYGLAHLLGHDDPTT